MHKPMTEKERQVLIKIWATIYVWHSPITAYLFLWSFIQGFLDGRFELSPKQLDRFIEID